MTRTIGKRLKKSGLWTLACVWLLIGTALSQVEKSSLAPEDANEARLNRLQPPDKVMDIIGLTAGMTIAEIGAGRGRYVVHLADLTDPKLPPGALDLIFVISSYHHFSDPVTLMRNARPSLKPAGRLAIAEWVTGKDGHGEGTSPETMTAQMESAGFILERIDKSFEDNRLSIYLFRLRSH